jgi:hypothetical protein
MERELVDDELWKIIQPLLPIPRRRNTHPYSLPLVISICHGALAAAHQS